MSGNKQLSTLLQYRFVRKSVPKITKDDDDETLNSSKTSDVDSQETIPPTDDSQRTLPYSQESLIPETPESQIPHSTESEATSPVFKAKPKVARTNHIIESDESFNEASSPWLCKNRSPLTNGKAENKKKIHKRIKKSFHPSSDSDSDNSEPHDKKSSFKLNFLALKQMFPAKSEQDLKDALVDDVDLNTAIDIVTGKKPPRRKRPREEDDELPEIQPLKKRIKEQCSSSQEDGTNSGITVMDSQMMEDKISFLKEAFPEHPKKVLWKVLEKHEWSVEAATEAISLGNTEDIMPKDKKIINGAKKKKEKHKTDSDEEEDYNDGDDIDSDDSMEDETGGQTGRDTMLLFFNSAGLEEIISIPNCTKKKAEIIIQKRPYVNWVDLYDKFSEKPLSFNLITGCKEIIHVREVIVKLMQRCETISMEMETVVEHLTNNRGANEGEITKQPELLNAEMELKPYQLIGLNWLRIMHSQHVNGILADEMGLGKTVQAIAFLSHLLEEGECGPHVIIVPSSTIENWMRELELWCPSLGVLVYYGTQDERRYSRHQILYNDVEFNVVLTTYNMATGSTEDRQLFKKVEFHYAIFDEGHMLKNMSSLRYQNLMKISAERRLLLTGTPLQNNLLELMSLLSFVMPDMFTGKSEHLKKMFSAISKVSDEDKKSMGGKSSYLEDRIAHAKRIMKPFLLRRLKTEVLQQLPKKVDNTVFCQLIPDQQEIYDKMLIDFSKKLEEDRDLDNKAGAGMLMKLRKCANHPLLIRNRYNDEMLNEMAERLSLEPSHQERGALPHLIKEDMSYMSDFEIHKLCHFYSGQLKEFALDVSIICESAKFRMLDEYFDEMKSKGDRVLLFSQFTMVLDIVEVYLKERKHKFLRLDGGTPVTERQTLIDQYNSNSDIFVFIISTRAGGLGINLTAANVVFLHDIDFNPYNDKQAEDRCHRLGQKRDVRIIRFISKDTVEEGMLRCAQEKLKLEKEVTTSNLGENEEVSTDVLTLLQEALKKAGKKGS